MKKDEAIKLMVAPGSKRPSKWRGGVIQISLTRACDKSCFNCTQGSNLRGKSEFISLGHFEQAVSTLTDYFGVVGIFGGNPALHPKFEEICKILQNYIPKEQRGLWCNNPVGKTKIMRETFNPSYSNLNVHLDSEAYAEFKSGWPEAHPVGLNEDSRHAPVHLAMKDVIEDESERWNRITTCDINHLWSPMITVFREELRAYFCEIAGAQAVLNQHKPDYPDTGIPVVKDWWKKPIEDFQNQIEKHCHECAVPLRGYGELSQSTTGTEITSKTHADIYKPKKVDRPVKIAFTLEELKADSLSRVTNYIQNGKN
jgi:hypothetical protein